MLWSSGPFQPFNVRVKWGHFHSSSVFLDEPFYNILCLWKPASHHLAASMLSSQQGEKIMVWALISSLRSGLKKEHGVDSSLFPAVRIYSSHHNSVLKLKTLFKAP